MAEIENVTKADFFANSVSFDIKSGETSDELFILGGVARDVKSI